MSYTLVGSAGEHRPLVIADASEVADGEDARMKAKAWLRKHRRDSSRNFLPFAVVQSQLTDGSLE
jgi:hypothetical protein